MIHVDEAHCIKTWGGSGFRKAWYELGKMRAFVRNGVPFAAYSATMPPSTINTIRKSLHINPNSHTLINKGNFRRNLFWDIKNLSGGKSALNEITQYLPPISAATPNIPLSIIFVNDRNMGHLVYHAIMNYTPPNLRSQVYLLHSLRSEDIKVKIMDEVRNHGRGFLVCTDIATLVSSTIRHTCISDLIIY